MNSNKLNSLDRFLKENHCFYEQDFNLKYSTYFKTGGNTKFYLKPTSITEMELIIKFLSENEIDFKVIGFTTNTLFLDELEYAVIISTKGLSSLSLENNIVTVEAGYSLQELARVALINSAKGYEGLEGIPASIGGGIFMNAGAYGSSISDHIIDIKCLDENNNIVVLDKASCHFSYRDSIFKTGKYIILSARFQFEKGNQEESARKMETYHIARHSYQEFAYPTLGSMISMREDIYLKIMNKNLFYKAYFWFLKLFYKNPVVKFINRKRPQNIAFNNLLSKYLIKKEKLNHSYNFSVKNANILKNDGSKTTKELVDHIHLMHKLIEESYHVENEIILEPVYRIPDYFIEDYNKLKNKLNTKE